MEYLGPVKVRNFKALSTLWSGCDALGICSLRLGADAAAQRAHDGGTAGGHHWLGDIECRDHALGERRMHLMRMYNLREGLTAADDRLPDRFFDEAISQWTQGRGQARPRRIRGRPSRRTTR